MFGYTIEKYIERKSKKVKNKREKYIARLKANGQDYYTPDRLNKIANAMKIVSLLFYCNIHNRLIDSLRQPYIFFAYFFGEIPTSFVNVLIKWQ